MVPNQPTTGIVNDAGLPLGLSGNRKSIKQLDYKSKPTQPQKKEQKKKQKQ